MPLISGAVPQLSSSRAPLVQFDSSLFWSLTRPPRLSFSATSSDAADPVLQPAGVVGNGSLQFGGHVEHQCHREHEHHNAADQADPTLVAAECADPLGDPLAGQREEQQRQGGTDRERQRQRDGVQSDRAGGAGDDDGGQNRSGARHIEHTQGQAEAESALTLANLKLWNAGEGLFQDLLEPGKDEAKTDGGQRDQARPPDRVLRKVQQRKQCRP